MEKLMKSFGLFADEDGYWFVTKEDHDIGNFLLITYQNRIAANITVQVLNNKIYYTNLCEVFGYEKAKETVARLLREIKEKLTEIHLEKIQEDF